MKIAYKGTDKDMKCRGVQYELGKTYYIDSQNKVSEVPSDVIVLFKEKVKLCSNNCIHYCNELPAVYKHYPLNKNNRFFKIEVIGDFEDGGDKSGAKCIRFIEEISAKELKEELLDTKMQLEEVRNLQKEFPTLIIGGSIALYLQGIRLERYESGNCDFDIILPYYQKLNAAQSTVIEESDELDEEHYDGNDFQNIIYINGTKADLRIDPHQKYEVVVYKEHSYKVASLLDIIAAKIKYAKTKGGKKHFNDVYEMLNIK